MNNKVIKIGTITVKDQIKALKVANREIEITNGKKIFHTVVKDKRKEASKMVCRKWKNGLAY